MTIIQPYLDLAAQKARSMMMGNSDERKFAQAMLEDINRKALNLVSLPGFGIPSTVMGIPSTVMGILSMNIPGVFPENFDDCWDALRLVGRYSSTSYGNGGTYAIEASAYYHVSGYIRIPLENIASIKPSWTHDTTRIPAIYIVLDGGNGWNSGIEIDEHGKIRQLKNSWSTEKGDLSETRKTKYWKKHEYR